MCCVACVYTSMRYEEIYGEIGITDTLLTIQGIKYNDNGQLRAEAAQHSTRIVII
jgi:hypothetical protein